MIYLDHAATSPVRREVIEAMWPFLTGEFGNPSSHHELGERAARALALAREEIATEFGARPAGLVVTSGGTEADNLAVKGIALAAPRGRHIVTSAIEHEAVEASCDYLERLHGFEITRVPVDPDGLVDADAVTAALRPDTTLVTVMHSNNEIGVVQPIARIAELAHGVGARVHSDAVQSAGWFDLSLETLGVDAITVSGHKFGAPKGVGALALRPGVLLEPVIHGGGQERGRRSGTENVAGAVGLAAAIRLSRGMRDTGGEVARRRDALIDGVLDAAPSTRLTGPRDPRLPNHASFCFPGTSGEAVLLELERRGVVCSSGSACAAGSDEPSRVLLALGIPPEVAQTAVRFTLDGSTTDAEVAETIARVAESLAALAAYGSRVVP